MAAVVTGQRRSQLKGYEKPQKRHLQCPTTVSFTMVLIGADQRPILEQKTQGRFGGRGAMDLQSLDVGELGIADDEVCESRRSKLVP